MANVEAIRAANIKVSLDTFLDTSGQSLIVIIKANKELLISLGLETPLIPTQVKAKTKTVSIRNKKRKPSAPLAGEDSRPAKTIKVAPTGDSDVTPGRRSTRNASKARVNYNETDKSSNEYTATRRPRLVSSVSMVDSETEHVGNRLGKRTHDP